MPPMSDKSGQPRQWCFASPRASGEVPGGRLRKLLGTAARRIGIAPHRDGGGGRLVAVHVKAATMPYNLRNDAHVSFVTGWCLGRLPPSCRCAQRPYTRLCGSAGLGWSDAAGRTSIALRRDGGAGRLVAVHGKAATMPHNLRNDAQVSFVTGWRLGRLLSSCRCAQRPYTRLCGSAGRGWSGAARGGMAGGRRARKAGSAQRPYTRLCGSAGRGWSGSARDGMAGGGRRARKADSAQRPYMRPRLSSSP